MKAVKEFENVKKNIRILMTMIQTNQENSEIKQYWSQICNQIHTIDQTAQDMTTDAKAKRLIHNSAVHTLDYMSRMINCFIKDCHPDGDKKWIPVKPNDSRWTTYYLPVCFDDCDRHMEWIDYIIDQEKNKNPNEPSLWR